jgi:uncharacterized protein (TIGR02246 family)
MMTISARRIRRSLSTRVALPHGRALLNAALAAVLFAGGCSNDSTKSAGPMSPGSAGNSADVVEDAGQERGRGDDAAVAALVSAWDTAWNAGDPAGLAATFFEDAEFINAMGRLDHGAAEIQAQHAISLAGQFRGSHTEGQIRRITFLGGTAAVIDVDNQLTRFEPIAPGSTTMREIHQSGRHKRVVVKRRGVWRVLLFQNTMITPPAIP